MTCHEQGKKFYCVKSPKFWIVIVAIVTLINSAFLVWFSDIDICVCKCHHLDFSVKYWHATYFFAISLPPSLFSFLHSLFKSLWPFSLLLYWSFHLVLIKKAPEDRLLCLLEFNETWSRLSRKLLFCKYFTV